MRHGLPSWFLICVATCCMPLSLTAAEKNRDLENIGERNINDGQWNLVSIEKEIAMGRQLAYEVERAHRLVDDAEVNEYVNRIGQNLVRNSDARVPFTIRVIDSEEINAMALPGGFFYVNTGLILAAEEEAELAAVMAHEIAHVTARHGTEQYTKGQIFTFASLPLIFLGGPIGYGIRQAAGILVPLQFLRFSRKSEVEADYLGLQYLYKTGYDPAAMISFFERIRVRDKKNPGLLAKAFATHPQTKNRIKKSKREIEEVLPENSEYVLNTSEFDRIKARLLAHENPRLMDDTQLDFSRPTLKRRTPAEVDDPAELDNNADRSEVTRNY